MTQIPLHTAHRAHALRERINTLLEDFYRKIGTQHTSVSGRAYHPVAAETDLSGDHDGLRLDIELPGVEEKDIEILVDGQNLIVRGEKRATHEVEGRTFYIAERIYGRFERVFRLPPEVDPERATARCRNGVLTITVPRRPESTGKGVRRIEIRTH